LSPCQLRAVALVEGLVQQCGLVRENPRIYGDDRKFLNPIRRGIWQIPRQLAEFAVFLSHRRINSFIELGTFTGGTFTFLMGYLAKFNPNLIGITVDPYDYKPPKHLWTGRFDAQFIIGSGRDFIARPFDLCLIDGWHNFEAVRCDYINVGRYSRICAFHDINDTAVESWPGNDGGVPRFWREFRLQNGSREFHEFLFHPRQQRVMGIGVVVHGESDPKTCCASEVEEIPNCQQMENLLCS
jgi:hypothetical protein